MVTIHLACSSRYEGELPNDCNDGADNDKDGLFDCQDNGCTNSPICIQATSAQKINCSELLFSNRNTVRTAMDQDGKLFTGKCEFISQGGDIIKWNYKNGLLHGTQTRYENGFKVEENYINGIKHGRETAWYPNGGIAQKREWKNANLLFVKEWDQEGNLTKDEICPCN